MNAVISSDKVQELYERACEYQNAQNYRDSIPHLKRIIGHIPHHFPALHLLGHAMIHGNKYQEATSYLKECLRHCPDYYPAVILLATLCYRSFGNYTEAESLLLNIKDKHPDVPEIYRTLCDFYMQMDDIEKARVYNQTYLSLQEEANKSSSSPTDLWEHRLMGELSIDPFFDSEKREKDELERLHLAMDMLLTSKAQALGFPKSLTSTAFYLGYYNVNPRPYLEKLSAVYTHIYPNLKWEAPHLSYKKDPSSKRKIQLGLVSTYLDKEHPIGYCFAPLIKSLDRTVFDITYFRLPETKAPCPSINIKEKLGRLIYIDLPPDIPKARKRIADEKIDILWYTDICMEAFSYFLAHSKLAPVQCVSAGHPTTTGLSTIDYYLSSDLLEHENAQENYTEELITLSSLPIFYEDFETSPPHVDASAFDLPVDKNLYLCSQVPFKIHPLMDNLFKSILINDKNALLVFSYDDSHWSKSLKKRLKTNLAEYEERYVFLSYVNRYQFYDLLNCVHVVLDTIPVSGGNTTFQAFSVGTPIVTFQPKDLRSSTTAGLFKLIDMSECIARSTEDYVQKAVQIGTDPLYRAQLKERILIHKHKIFQTNNNLPQSYAALFKNLMTAEKQIFKTRDNL